MQARHAALLALAATVTLSSVAGARPDAAKQRVAISAKILPASKFVLTPVQAGALKLDSGAFHGNWRSIPGRDVMRDGQKITIFHGADWTLEGRRGTLTIRERNEWVDIGNDANRDNYPDGIAVGTWKVVRGTGQYSGITGSGRSGHEGLGQVWFARYEGVLTVPGSR
jgi:hypothetical protein